MEPSSPVSRSFGDINTTIQELLLIELTSLTHRISKSTVLARESKNQNPDGGITLPTPSEEEDDEEDMTESELVVAKLDSIGYRVGKLLVEKHTKSGPLFSDALDMIKFVCRDLWIALFGKQMDNLKTNHKGVFVLTDYKFRWYFKYLSLNPRITGGVAYRTYLWFPCGIIRGALANLGMETTVTAECTNGPPSTAFQIKTITRTE